MEMIRSKVTVVVIITIIICKLGADSSPLQVTKMTQGNGWHSGN